MKTKYLFIILSMLIILTGCEKKSEIEEFKENVEIVDTTTVEESEVVNEETEITNSETSLAKDIKEEKKEKSIQITNDKETKTQPTTTIKKEETNTTKYQPKKTEEVKATTKVEQPKENIWDKLGMTEYQYYNEPMYKWEKVDFSVEKYGSENAAREACAKYGDQYEPYLNGEVLYNCSTVTTASGKYLGEWFHTEKLYQ